MEIFARFRTPSATRILNELLDELRELQRSKRHIDGLRGDLRVFIKAYPNISRWRAVSISGYLRQLGVGPRRRDNIRNSIVTLSRFARLHGYLNGGKISEAEKVRKINPSSDISTWTPAEAGLLLEQISPHWLPCEVLGLFAGLRKSEILRLDWSAFKWDMAVIAITRKVARKTRMDRLVPILPTLATWLRPYRERVGPLYPGAFKTNENAHSRELVRVRLITGLARKDNAHRHTFGSYRLAIVKSYEQVALEMGNSVRKVRENYNDPKPESEALRYFAPRLEFENIVPMALALEFR